MREIIFRGKRKDYGKWIEGYYLHQNKRKFVNETHYIVSVDGFYYSIDPSTVCQHTGLTDKNGRKIFEGDIVERGGRIWLVEYSNKYGQFMMTTYTEKGISWSRSFDLIPPDWCEVIGNIYDNPELLKGGNDNG